MRIVIPSVGRRIGEHTHVSIAATAHIDNNRQVKATQQRRLLALKTPAGQARGSSDGSVGRWDALWAQVGTARRRASGPAGKHSHPFH